MKYLHHIAATLLGLGFIAFGGMFLLNLVPDQPPPPEGSPVALFMGAFVPTGYLTFVKVLEVLGGVLVLIPKLRNIGLLVLGPIIVNILAFHLFITGGHGLFDPPILVIVFLALYLLMHERKAFGKLITR